MKVFIMGDLPTQPAVAEVDRQALEIAFHETCKNIAIFLQEGNHEIILAGAIEPYADYYIIKATQDQMGNPSSIVPKIRIYSAHGDSTEKKLTLEMKVFLDSFKAIERFSNITSYEFIHSYALRQADLLLVIGGGDTSTKMYEYAVTLNNKSVLAFASFGGSGKYIYDRIFQTYRSNGVPEKLLNVLHTGVSKSNKDDFIKLLNSAYNKNPWKPSFYSSHRALICAALLSSLLLISAWMLSTYYFEKSILGIIPICIGSGAFGGVFNQLTDVRSALIREEYNGLNLTSNIGTGATVGLTIAGLFLGFIKIPLQHLADIAPNIIMNIKIYSCIFAFLLSINKDELLRLLKKSW